MTPREPGMLLRIFAALAVAAIIVIGCATTEPPASAPPPAETGQASQSGDVSLEEIVVTGSVAKSGRTDRFRQAPASLRSTAHQLYEADMGGARPPDFGELSSDEELWVIAKPTFSAQQQVRDDAPGTGAMVAKIPPAGGGAAEEIPLPLEHTAVNANIDGYISTVAVTQQFHNPFDTKIEAVYLFPLPEKSAVSEFLMVIGERRIRGILREKEEAEAIYNQARAQGYQASLLVQHRPNIFEQKVANIEPGKSIDVDITYFHTLAYDDGWYSFVFPTVVGPRFNPPGSSDPVAAVPRGASAASGSGTSVSYLRPNERSGHDISINVNIDAGVAIEELDSTHAIATERPSPETAEVALASKATIPNRDFVLNFRVAGETVKSNVVTYRDPDSGEGYFTMMLYPPMDHAAFDRQPMEMVFVLDCSGSMRGRPLDQAKAAVSAALDHLQEGDTFQIIRFSENSTQLGNAPLPATRENISLARRYLARLSGTGGTMMIEGIKAALDFPHDPSRLRFVSFMTDGYIGNELEIIGAVHDRIGDARIFSFGVGSSVNRYLMERMAKTGRGAVAYLGPQDSAKDIMNGFFARISHPALTDLEIDWGNAAVSDVYPAQLPDLFVGRSVVVTGRFTGSLDTIRVNGTRAGSDHSIAVQAGDAAEKAAVSRIWARLRIADLADRQAWQPDPQGELENDIRATALKYQLMSDYTSFVAVDTSRQTEGDYGVTVHQAVPVPEGVRYDTTVN